ncbi:MAG: GWxTD domain-containing protein, partial [Acidobacteriota bacterium]
LEEEVVYIITQGERERFLALQSDEARDRFIANFWDLRDPIRETLVNEYREEHRWRIAEANRRFGRETSRDGWRTDRGRIFILLGEPNDIQRFPSPRDLYPLEIWHYYNLDIPGLPPALRLIFFKRRGIGEFRLFSPTFDGLPALVAGHQLLGLLGNNPYRRLPARLLLSIDRDILDAAVSVAPGYNKQASDMVIADLERPGVAHERMIRDLRERVRTDVVFTTQMNVAFTYHAFQGPYDFTEIHFAVEVPPQDLTFTKYDDVFRGRVDIVGVLVDLAGNTVEEFQDVAEFSFTSEAFDSAKSYPFLYQRKILMLPGRYQMEILLRDSVGRRLGISRQAIQVAPFSEDRPTASSLLLAYKLDESDPRKAEALPYRFGSTQYFPRVDSTFAPGQPVYAFLKLRFPSGGETAHQIRVRHRLLREDDDAREATHRFRVRSSVGEQTVPILVPLSTDGLEPGAYTLELELRDEEDRLIDESEGKLQLQAGRATLGRLIAEGELTSEPSQSHLELGMKYYFAGRLDQASRRLRAALDFDPRLLTAKLYLGRARAMEGDCAQAGELLTEVVEQDPTAWEAHASLGYCLFQQERFAESAAAYREALRYGPEKLSLLNALGQSELRAGNRQGAMDVFS